MRRGDIRIPAKVSDGAGDLDQTVVSAGGQFQLLDSGAEQRLDWLRRRTVRSYLLGTHLSVAEEGTRARESCDSLDGCVGGMGRLGGVCGRDRTGEPLRLHRPCAADT